MASKPRIRRTVHNTQLTYNLPGRIHDLQTYPVLSPQGATVLIYGHDTGFTVVWRGGKRFKAAASPPPPAPSKPNGNVEDSVMVIDDSSDDDVAQKNRTDAFEDRPEFEDEADDSLYPEVMQTLDLTVGAPVLHIAVLPMSPCPAEEASWAGLDLLKEKMVFAISCSTSDVYVVMLPLAPPSPQSKARPELRRDLIAGRAGSGAWGESILPLLGQAARSHGISVALVKPKSSSTMTTTTSGRARDNAGDSPSITPRPRVVVASHTREASGTLRLWDVVLDTAKPGLDDGSAQPFQTEFLPGYLSRISFNPTHATQLLVVFPQNAVRVYDYSLPSMLPAEPSTGPFPSQGSWLLSLYPPFARPSGNRKTILDAAWITHGRAVLVLLADGMWGVWDVDGASPSAPTLMGKQASGIRGAAITSFSASGFVEGTGSLRGVGAPSSSQGKPNNDFVPMTPHTRRDATASLNASATSPERLAAVRGGMSVVALPATGTSSDESVVLWIGGLEHVCVIPGVSRFWDAQIRKGAGGGVNLFSGAQPTRMIRLRDLHAGLLGERCCGVGALVDLSKQRDGLGDGGLPVDVVVRGETRMAVVRDADENPGPKIGNGNGLTGLRSKSGRSLSAAIIVNSQADKKAYNLSVSKPGILRLNRTNGLHRDGTGVSEDEDESGKTAVVHGPPMTGLAFTESMNAAADAVADVAKRDIEVEMLDILDLDRALDNMEERRDSGRKRVLFDERAHA